MAKATKKTTTKTTKKKAKPTLSRREARICIGYEAVREVQIAKFNKACNALIAKGWQPLGGISTSCGNEVTAYSQAFAIYEDQFPEDAK